MAKVELEAAVADAAKSLDRPLFGRCQIAMISHAQREFRKRLLAKD